MLEKLGLIGRSWQYWLVVLLVTVVLEAAALYYQHVLNEWPCVLCIHVRIWLLVLLPLALVGLMLRGKRLATGIIHLLTAVVSAGIVERSWLLLGTERGTLQAECAINLGFPSWFAIDQWFPNVFGVWTSCGYTPELFWGITMAEALLVISIMLLLLSLMFVLVLFIRRDRLR